MKLISLPACMLAIVVLMSYNLPTMAHSDGYDPVQAYATKTDKSLEHYAKSAGNSIASHFGLGKGGMYRVLLSDMHNYVKLWQDTLLDIYEKIDAENFIQNGGSTDPEQQSFLKDMKEKMKELDEEIAQLVNESKQCPTKVGKSPDALEDLNCKIKAFRDCAETRYNIAQHSSNIDRTKVNEVTWEILRKNLSNTRMAMKCGWLLLDRIVKKEENHANEKKLTDNQKGILVDLRNEIGKMVPQEVTTEVLPEKVWTDLVYASDNFNTEFINNLLKLFAHTSVHKRKIDKIVKPSMKKKSFLQRARDYVPKVIS